MQVNWSPTTVGNITVFVSRGISNMYLTNIYYTIYMQINLSLNTVTKNTSPEAYLLCFFLKSISYKMLCTI